MNQAWFFVMWKGLSLRQMAGLSDVDPGYCWWDPAGWTGGSRVVTRSRPTAGFKPRQANVLVRERGCCQGGQPDRFLGESCGSLIWTFEFIILHIDTDVLTCPQIHLRTRRLRLLTTTPPPLPRFVPPLAPSGCLLLSLSLSFLGSSRVALWVRVL